ncbi:MAG: twin-arginine translocation signal domain-containing protein, partial [Pyrinomonadaceae bacterium]|nr:twin-arginine translocation signal domain-containing protein [Pyrinomonadaceae bacterium]
MFWEKIAMGQSKNKTRRNFIKLAAGATVVAGASKTFMLSRAQDQSGVNEATKNISPNDRIQIAT